VERVYDSPQWRATWNFCLVDLNYTAVLDGTTDEQSFYALQVEPFAVASVLGVMCLQSAAEFRCPTKVTHATYYHTTGCPANVSFFSRGCWFQEKQGGKRRHPTPSLEDSPAGCGRTATTCPFVNVTHMMICACRSPCRVTVSSLAQGKIPVPPACVITTTIRSTFRPSAKKVRTLHHQVSSQNLRGEGEGGFV